MTPVTVRPVGVAGCSEQLWTSSYAPISQPAHCGLVMPRWSVLQEQLGVLDGMA